MGSDVEILEGKEVTLLVFFNLYLGRTDSACMPTFFSNTLFIIHSTSLLLMATEQQRWHKCFAQGHPNS